MSTILYLDNHYINSLEQLRQIIVKAIKEDETALCKEIETLFKDGIIQKWLEEGNLDCHKLLSSLILIPQNTDSSKLKEKIGNVFSDEQIRVNRFYSDFIELTESSYSEDGKTFSIINNDKFEISTKVDLSCSVKFFFKVLKQDSESFSMSLLLNNQIICESQNLDVRLYRDGEIAVVTFDNVFIRKGFKHGVLTLKIDDDIVKSIQFTSDDEKVFDLTGKDGKIIHFTMKRIKGGIFNMSPDYEVELTDYYIGQFLVTQELWEAVMNNNPSNFIGEHNPVENVCWNDICGKNGFIHRINRKLKDQIPLDWRFALPTEAQWFYAAIGGEKRKNQKFAGTEMASLLKFFGWYNENSEQTTHPVGNLKPNELGLYDMCGNVWEWCYDFYGGYPNGKFKNPKGPNNGNYHIGKGGSYYNSAEDCLLSNRKWWVSYKSADLLGFRLCLVKK